jgi:hypothetical protein
MSQDNREIDDDEYDELERLLIGELSGVHPDILADLQREAELGEAVERRFLECGIEGETLMVAMLAAASGLSVMSVDGSPEIYIGDDSISEYMD